MQRSNTTVMDKPATNHVTPCVIITIAALAAKTIEKINDGKKWLILIDELFKGTNVQDAMKCSSTVIDGLRKMHNSLFILSTHLYEIGEALKVHPNIQFKYFETSVVNDQLQFSYQLKDGISNDRLGYLILKREGVVQLLERL